MCRSNEIERDLLFVCEKIERKIKIYSDNQAVVSILKDLGLSILNMFPIGRNPIPKQAGEFRNFFKED